MRPNVGADRTATHAAKPQPAVAIPCLATCYVSWRGPSDGKSPFCFQCGLPSLVDSSERLNEVIDIFLHDTPLFGREVQDLKDTGARCELPLAKRAALLQTERLVKIAGRAKTLWTVVSHVRPFHAT